MRIAFICGFAWEPKGTVRARAYPLAAELVKRGHEVTIFLTPYDNPADSGKECTFGGVRIKNLQAGRVPLLKYPRLLAKLCKAIDSYSPDLVHVFKPKGFSGAACTYLLMKGIRTIVLDCDDWEGWGGWNEVADYPWAVKEFIDFQEKLLIHRTPVITAASRTLIDRAKQLGKDPSCIFYVPNCVSGHRAELDAQISGMSVLEEKKSLGLPDAPVIFYAGHFEPVDDVMFFCRATAPVAARYGAAIALVGEGADLERTKTLLSRSELQVFSFGRLPFQQYARVLKASDIAIFPYPDNPVYRAKCSARILDYMSFGKPILTSAIGQNLEYINDEENGLLVPASDERAYQEALERLLRDAELRMRLGQNARKKVLTDFLWEGAAIENCMSAYMKALGHKVAVTGI